MNKVREQRHEQRMVMAELSVKAKVSSATLVMIERYGYIPSPKMDARENRRGAGGLLRLLYGKPIENLLKSEVCMPDKATESSANIYGG
jgi:hypothetical protein